MRSIQLRSCVGQVHARSQKPVRLRTNLPCRRKGEGLNLPPLPELLNRARLAIEQAARSHPIENCTIDATENEHADSNGTNFNDQLGNHLHEILIALRPRLPSRVHDTKQYELRETVAWTLFPFTTSS